ncbi:MAG: hypothetical protein Q7J42_18860 [Sulfuritalea sp.]|nr:hypothetical protein [Sulfuritalea sp.]
MNVHALLPKLIGMVVSWLDAGNLRNRVYDLDDKLEIARVAIEDIRRMNDLDLIRDLAGRTLEKL